MKILFTVLLGVLLAPFAQAQTTTKFPSGYLYKIEAGAVGRQVYVCNQRPFNTSGELVGVGNLTAQTQQVFENLKTALGTVGMTLRNVKQVTYHVKGQTSQVNSAISQQVNSVSATYFTQGAPGIAEIKSIPKIASDDILVEVEVIAEK
ncbi:RidA family protein [Spirosoma endbachense]|uniref:RidA family protein n=1 Tax=Spirosoma endbachense TaxID=2666025 RepID=A0A6P1W6A6_9BACT|nr:RidA family protein [Spirosoma endbachense]QHW00962.1 RidA family protein [Spirosoma endbachense]